MAGCETKGLPKTMRWLHHFRHSSTTVMDMRTTPQTIMNLSWLKLRWLQPRTEVEVDLLQLGLGDFTRNFDC